MRLALAIFVLLALPGSAVAATWSPPQHLSGAHTFVDDPSLMVAGGRALAVWQFQDGIGNGAHAGTSAASRPPGVSAFGDSHRLPAGAVAVTTFGSDGALLATTTSDRMGNATRLFVRTGNAAGRFGKPALVRRDGVRIVSVSLAADARGDAALAWFEDRGTRTDRVYVALRRAGHAFGAPRRLVTGRIRSVATAIGAAGDVLVAWDARGVLRARFKPHSVSGFRATDTIRSHDAFSADLHPVVTPGGRAVLAWSAQFASEGGTTGPQFFQEAIRPSGASRFRRAILLDRVDSPGGTFRALDAAGDGNGVAVAWTGTGGHVRVVRGAGAPQDLGPGFLSDLAGGPGGRLIVVWDDGVDANPSTVHAAVAPGASAPFGAAEAVSPVGEDSRFGHAAFDGSRPTIVYSGRPLPTTTFAEAVTRSE